MLSMALAVGCLTSWAADKQPTRGVIRVKLQPEMALKVGQAPRMQAMGTMSTGIAPFDRAAKAVKATQMRRMVPYAPKFEAQRAKFGLDRWYVIEFDESMDPEQARKVFASTAGVEKSEVVVPMSLKEGTGEFVTAPAPAGAPKAAMPFNDPRLPEQWHYQNYGNMAGCVAGADINLFDAWQVTTGDPSVVVAIIDGGVDYRHEDLAQNMLVNEAELNGLDGVDDDGNGYVDDIYGYNFCTNSGEIYPHNHGTHVAGTVAAVNNNGIGVAGVAGGNGRADSGVRMISCQVFESRSGVPDGDFAAAIIYAAERGATIAQCSWGWGAPDYKEQAVLDAIDYFTSMARSDKMIGGLCIFASGNDGSTGDYYPGCYEPVLCVASMTSELAPASYSNYGEWVDIIAPGGLMDYSQAQGVLSTLPNDNYGFNEGTSMATPHVSGIAALILSKYGSPSFLNETLRTQLLTSVNDFYGYGGGKNEAYRGLYGAGYIDAAKALAMGNGEAPEAVSDLRADAAQDYISLTWTIPASSDNNVNHHIIYYSTEPFTSESDLSKLQARTADTKFVSSGDVFTYELGGLQSLTKYYVAVVAVNRWGQAAEMSAVVEVTTNAGPETVIENASLTMTSTAEEMLAKGTFDLFNKGAGLLNWKGAKRTVKVNAQGVLRPTLSNVGPYNGKLAGQKPAPYARVNAEYEAGEYPKVLKYYDEKFAYIGDSDRSLPNSMAQWFRVDPTAYPDGFNLTALKIEGMNGTKPVIQIYKGDVSISAASLIAEVEYPYFAYGFDVNLNEQLFFSPGESFWVVVHFAGNQEGYPLCIALTENEGISQYSYMSNDMGQTWVPLTTALAGSAYETYAPRCTWAIHARSLNPDWSEFLELSPASGTVRSNERQTVEVSADGSRIVNGTYQFNILVETNENADKVKKVPAQLTVSGNEPEIIVPKVVDFGNLLVGQSKTMTVSVYNKGYGSFRGSPYGAGGLYGNNMEVSNANFKGPDGISNGFPARNTTEFDLTFAPTEAGTHSGAVTFTDYQGRQVRIVLQGSATEPAKMTLDPSVIDAGTLTVGDEAVTRKFIIRNDGKYPLEYVFPKFSDATVSDAQGTVHRFGYTVQANLKGYETFAYDGNPAVIGATNIASSFSDDQYFTDAIALGFNFPFYGETYDKIYISSYGVLSFGTNPDANFWPPLSEGSSSIVGTGMIAAFGSELKMNPSSKVEYARQDGKFVVKYTDVLACVYGTEYTPISFHIALSANGDIEIFYDNFPGQDLFQQSSGLFCGLTDKPVEDPMVVTSAAHADYWGNETPTDENQRFREFTSGTAVKFCAPKAQFVRSLAPADGMILPGESAEVTATMMADESLYAGETFNSFAILSNDPNPSVKAVRFDAVIAGEGLVGRGELEQTEYQLGDIFRTAVVKVPVTVKNGGKDKMTILSASAEGFTVETALPAEVAPGMSKDIVVAVPTDVEGEISGTLTVETSTGALSAAISGRVIGCPAVELSFNSIDETVESGAPLQKTLTVSNTGNEALKYAITPDPLVRLTLPEKTDAHTSYIYASSADDSSVKFDWVDIETNGLGTQNTQAYYMLHDYVAVDLPFEFPFYGKKYSRMYIYNTGFVSFTERHDDKLWPEPPADFPEGTVYNNIIAPYWGLHSMDQTKTAGTFYHVTEDRAVVSFMEYGNSMNLGVCYQLIMEKDGSFKFQYKGLDEYSIIYGLFGLAGISNDDYTQYVRLPERMVAFNQAVQFHPVVEMGLEPGATDNVEMEFVTDRMAGTYSTSLKMSTNIPQKENIDIPLTLNITGTPAPVWPENVVVEHTIGYQSMDTSDPSVGLVGAPYGLNFSIGNEGKAAFTIVNICTAAWPMMEDDFGPMPIFNLLVNAPELDWESGEPTGNYMWQMYSEPFMPLTITDKPLQFAVPMTQDPAYWATPGEIELPVTVVYVDGGMDALMEDDVEYKQAEFTLKFVVTPCPAMEFDKDEIYVKAPADDYVSTETITISNNGEYRLDVNLRLDPTGVGEELPGFGGGDGGIDPWMARHTAARDTAAVQALMDGLKAEIKPMDKSENSYDTPQDFEYRDGLYYPAMAASTAAYNYGSNNLYSKYKAATVFTAPAEGFNLSHIYTAVTVEEAKNVDIRVEVITGADPELGQVVGKGTLHIAGQENPASGSFYVIPLENSVYMNPGEQFSVVITYPEGIRTPSYLVRKEEGHIAGRYLGWVENFGWFDVAEIFEEQYGSLGYILSCLETTKGESWIKMLSAEGDHSVGVGESMDINIQLNAATARLEKGNKAVLVIKSNDPNMPLLNLPITLDKNGTPVIEGFDGVLYANEGEETRTEVTVMDPDLDRFTVRFAADAAHATLVAVEPAEGDAAVVEPVEGEENAFTVTGATEPVKAVVSILPEYGSAGADVNSFVVEAEDEAGHRAWYDGRYMIVHVNRAPVAAPQEDIALGVGTVSGIVSYASLFTDPDGDILTYTFDMDLNDVADAYTTRDGVIFVGKAEGTATATVTATDPSGAVTTLTLTIVVSKDTGVDNILGGADEVIYYDMRGIRVYKPTPGVYLVKRGVTVTKETVE